MNENSYFITLLKDYQALIAILGSLFIVIISHILTRLWDLKKEKNRLSDIKKCTLESIKHLSFSLVVFIEDIENYIQQLEEEVKNREYKFRLANYSSEIYSHYLIDVKNEDNYKIFIKKNKDKSNRIISLLNDYDFYIKESKRHADELYSYFKSSPEVYYVQINNINSGLKDLTLAIHEMEISNSEFGKSFINLYQKYLPNKNLNLFLENLNVFLHDYYNRHFIDILQTKNNVPEIKEFNNIRMCYTMLLFTKNEILRNKEILISFLKNYIDYTYKFIHVLRSVVFEFYSQKQFDNYIQYILHFTDKHLDLILTNHFQNKEKDF